MGYRHQVISDTMAPKADLLPKWFRERYEEIIDFDRRFWASRGEHKRYSALSGFERDVQRVVQELELNEIRLIYFADESYSHHPDISHISITSGSIVEIRANFWKKI